jgi:hypothetical protein
MVRTCAACRSKFAAGLVQLLRSPHPGIAVNQHYVGDGDIVYRQACKLGCEGIVSKRLGSTYRSGRSKQWVKIKNPGGAGSAARGGGRIGVGSGTDRTKFMSALVVAIITFLSVLGAAFLGLFSKTRLPSGLLREDTNSLVRSMVNFFIVGTSLLLGLMLNSAMNALEANNGNVRALATEIILLDRTMRALGPETEDARRRLVEYIKAVLSEWQDSFGAVPRHEASLEAAGISLSAIRVPEEQKATWEYARDLYRQVIRQRRIFADALGRTIPTPLIILLILQLVFINAGLGYGAPRNIIVTTVFVLAALLASAALFLIVDMDTPTAGILAPIQVSNIPLQTYNRRWQSCSVEANVARG